MTIICGTDFSPSAAQAARVAALLARRRGMPLLLVHVREPLTTRAVLASHLKTAAEDERRLHEEAARLQAIAPVVHAKLLAGLPEEELAEIGRGSEDWLVLGAHGQRSSGRWWLGSVAERTAYNARVPVLVVRNAEPLLRWLADEAPLRVLLGVDSSLPSRAAANWLRQWCGLGRCALMATRVVPHWSAAWWLQASGSGTGIGRSFLEEALREEVASILPEFPEGTTVDTQVRFTDRSVGEELVELSRETGCKLLVAGTHQRSLLGRALHGAVSGFVLRYAQTNVATVPVAPAEVPHLFVPRLKRVVVATDLSALSNQAIPYAYSVVEVGGTVTLVHVLSPATRRRERTEEARCRSLLERLTPPWAADKGVTTRVEVLVAPDVPAALIEISQQLQADLLCLTSHGRGGLRRTLAGSVARVLSKDCSIPLLLLRPHPND